MCVLPLAAAAAAAAAASFGGTKSNLKNPWLVLACLHPLFPLFVLQSYSPADWDRHVSWRRYIPEPHFLSIVVLSLAPVWIWSMAVSVALGCYVQFAEASKHPLLRLGWRLRRRRPSVAGCLSRAFPAWCAR